MDILVIDPRIAGISGDMFLGAIIDLTGVEDPLYSLANAITDLLDYVSSIKIEVKDVRKRGIRAKQVFMDIDEHFHHIMASDIRKNAEKLCEIQGLSEKATGLVKKTLDELIASEVAVHGFDPSKAHFHELASADTLLDIIGTYALLERSNLLDSEIYAMPPALGSGYIEISHGRLPVPAPAVLEILKRHRFSVSYAPVEAELTTPTGAALLVNLAHQVVNFIPPMTIEGIGYGAATGEFENIPNILRLVKGSRDELTMGRIVTLETHVDDVSGEVLGHMVGKLMEEGAIDVAIIPMITKKNRPGHLIKVLAELDNYQHLVDVLMRESGTLGVRIIETPRIVANRSKKPVPLRIDGKEFQVRVKVSKAPDGNIINMKPEYDDLREAAEQLGIPLREVMELAKKDIIERKEEILRTVLS